jgi:D-tyrosyl-tRNA(Tyr) deacylase
MRALVQRVERASVTVSGEVVGRIGPGLLVFLGVFPDDTPERADKLAERTAMLRIFADDEKPLNRSVVDVGGEVLVVSQFTLAADTSRGRRPSLSGAAPPAVANALYQRYVTALERRVARVATGRFGADMKVELLNDGPVTLLLEETR